MLPPGSSLLEVGNFGDSLGQFLMKLGLLGQFFVQEKPQKTQILAKKLSLLL
jgi:hypothetical protein